MTVTDAYWEKRNLGLVTLEVQVESGDETHKIIEQLNTLTAEYIVLKIPNIQSDVIYDIQQMGYCYIEDMIHMEHDLRRIQRNSMHQRLYDAMSYRKMTDEDIDCLKAEISDGLFSTDRISLDPFFDCGKAAERYLNWLNDMLDNKALPYLILYKESPAGFVILQTKDGKIYDSVLGGGYKQYRNTGLGIVQKEPEIVMELGGKKLETHVSTNNPGQVRALELNGYITKDINHVFVKHSNII